MNSIIKDGSYGIKIVRDHKTEFVKLGHFVFEFGKLHFGKDRKLVLPFILDEFDFKNPSQVALTIDRQKAQMLRNHLDKYIEQYDSTEEKTRHV